MPGESQLVSLGGAMSALSARIPGCWRVRQRPIATQVVVGDVTHRVIACRIVTSHVVSPVWCSASGRDLWA
jgi:hypothetical protein